MKCIICEKEFEKKGRHNRTKKKNFVTCSKECSIIYQRVHIYLWSKIRKRIIEEIKGEGE